MLYSAWWKFNIFYSKHFQLFSSNSSLPPLTQPVCPHSTKKNLRNLPCIQANAIIYSPIKKFFSFMYAADSFWTLGPSFLTVYLPFALSVLPFLPFLYMFCIYPFLSFFSSDPLSSNFSHYFYCSHLSEFYLFKISFFLPFLLSSALFSFSSIVCRDTCPLTSAFSLKPQASLTTP